MKKLSWLIAVGVLLFGGVLFFKWSSWGTAFLWDMSNGGTWLLPLVAVAALIDSINPCAFSVLLITIAFLLSIGKTRGRILTVGSSYILGLFVIYILIGLGILQVLHLFNTPHFMAKVGAIALIALGGINIINEFFPSFPIKLKIPQAAHGKMAALMEKASLPTAFLLGGLVGLCEFPCTGGPYLMVLGLLHDGATYITGFGYLIFYNLLFVLPLVVILLIATNESLFAKVRAWKAEKSKQMRFWGGALMILLGLAIFAL